MRHAGGLPWRNSARGVALISALLIVALAVTLAVTVTTGAGLRLRDADNARSLGQAEATARAAIDFGRWALRQDLIQDGRTARGQVDALDEAWAQALPAFPVEGGSVSGVVHDAQGLVNLNNLGIGRGRPSDLLLMQALLAQNRMDPNLANALKDWVDDDDNVTLPGGAEYVDYLALTPARRAANQPLVDVDELLRVRGFTPAMVAALRPYVTALPERTPVNVNTAPAAVIAALFQVGGADAEAFLQARAVQPFTDLDSMLKRAPEAIRQRLSGSANLGGTLVPQAGAGGGTLDGSGGTAPSVPVFGQDWSVNSHWFVIDARATYGRVEYGLSALVQRDTSTTGYPTVRWERRTLFPGTR